MMPSAVAAAARTLGSRSPSACARSLAAVAEPLRPSARGSGAGGPGTASAARAASAEARRKARAPPLLERLSSGLAGDRRAVLVLGDSVSGSGRGAAAQELLEVPDRPGDERERVVGEGGRVPLVDRV